MNAPKPITPHPFRDPTSQEQYYFDLSLVLAQEVERLNRQLAHKELRIKHLNGYRRTVSEMGMVFAFALILAMLFMTAFVDTHVTEMAWLIILGIAGVGIFQYCYVIYTHPRH